ncbi:hypothetical protein [Chryseobacterium scophthalmum]|uniref:hypothetical protein n=1 Tax=Chryseobacterium scophthalmum TaxID=59733 RepID=UPI001AEC69D9|nr:hypothetical protein [Chryseobacterium scophthalmum]
MKEKLKPFTSIIVIGFFLFIAYGSDDDSKNENYKPLKSDTNKVVSEVPLKTRLENNIKGFETESGLTKNLKSVDDIIIVLAVYKSYYIIIKEGKESTDNDEKKLAEKLEQKVSNSQVKDFPKLRLAYNNILKEKLWENDVDVKIGGSKNTILSLTAGYFASNKNIKTTQETLHEMLTNLRFKQVNYRWYKGEDEYTYYKIESAKDSEVIE